MTINMISKDFKQARAILRDAHIRVNADIHNKNSVGQLKILKAREENISFEIGLAERICGDNDKYPYRSSYYLTSFFQDLGFNYEHDGTTRRFWVRDVLLEMDVSQLSLIIENGLFRKQDFRNPKLRPVDKRNLPENEFLNEAIQDFKNFIDDSINANENVNLEQVLNLNVNIELLYENLPLTKDEELNKLIGEAKERFFNSGDRQIALEKFWDSFERLKTFYYPDKKHSTDVLINKLTIDLQREVFDNEFDTLTKIGNNYRIRHHETDKKSISVENQVKYLFFRMLALIDLSLSVVNETPEP